MPRNFGSHRHRRKHARLHVGWPHRRYPNYLDRWLAGDYGPGEDDDGDTKDLRLREASVVRCVETCGESSDAPDERLCSGCPLAETH